MSFNEIAVRVQNISKRYNIYDRPQKRLKQSIVPRLQRMIRQRPTSYFREFWALKDVSFEVKKGETVGIIGRNGAGKSTLLQIICGTLSPTIGVAETNGRVAALLELGAGFNPEFTGRENVFLNGALLGLSHKAIDNRFEEIAAFADIGGFIDQPVKMYSSGMYIRLAFAVQACLEPEILLVDEALAVGDERFQRKCYSYIDWLREKGAAILLVTHGTATIEKFCQRAVLIESGVIHGIGPSNQIVDQYHALLYSDEQAYKRFLKEAVRKGEAEESEANKVDINGRVSSDLRGQPGSGKLRAVITNWESLDGNGVECDLFRSGDKVTIRGEMHIHDHIDEIQAGVLIRTVEGVSAFGTSTLYYKENFMGASPGQKLVVEFTFPIALGEGVYFVSLAIAEPISACEMAYLDKKTDVLVLHVRQYPAKGSGIAALPVSMSFRPVD
jgi:lipopolysaccharide transport system ATP-binding protein